MSRVSDLENKVDALERNVGMLAKEACLDDCLMISDCSSIRKYKDGIECRCSPVKNDKGSWFVYKFSAAGYTLSIPGIGERVYNEAKKFYQTITEGKTKVQEYENEKNKAGEGEFIDKLEEKI